MFHAKFFRDKNLWRRREAKLNQLSKSDTLYLIYLLRIIRIAVMFQSVERQ